jgi:hypothetical protein
MTASAPKPCPFHVGRDLTAFDDRAGAFHGAKDTTRNFDRGEGVDIIVGERSRRGAAATEAPPRMLSAL